MKTEIIAVGTELLTLSFRDTNSLFLTEKLRDLGLPVSFRLQVGDDPGDLKKAVRAALGRSRLIIATGGLGPTTDDRTREVFAAALGRGLVFDAAILARIRERFGRRGLSVPPSNRKQCYVIEGAEVLENPNGTAPGLWIETPRRRIALLPGPPRELEPMFESQVRPRLAAVASGRRLIGRVLRLTGLGESDMESRIKSVYGAIPPGVGIITLACPGDLSIHLTYEGRAGPAEAEAVLDGVQRRLEGRLRPWVYSRGGQSLEAVVGGLLRSRGRTLACAESCTGGLLGHRLTNIPGSSDYFLESAVTYSNQAKTVRLGVPPNLIARHGAVSAPVARAMAAGIKEASGADYGLAVTGIAGPAGGTPRKPVGLVYIGLAHERGVSLDRNLFWGGRETVKFLSSQRALDILRKRLIKLP
jgi:nicotinamide-nucleotide amidase